jgi:hypothetical protein
MTAQSFISVCAPIGLLEMGPGAQNGPPDDLRTLHAGNLWLRSGSGSNSGVQIGDDGAGLVDAGMTHYRLALAQIQAAAPTKGWTTRYGAAWADRFVEAIYASLNPKPASAGGRSTPTSRARH